ncbi:MAG: hemerythrin domain-containing protein [Prevotella sp.]|nr:hemerythrin domain-containing protein [Bacteroides sp.]MCM1366145.1 hemerythrin domain-containing protein [Prevotella sp.]MCM1436790.1 hemerythrin domain-containing protein [Prevotella sp.]
MNNTYSYSPHDKMVTLIAENYQLIQVMSRFGIKVGFGDKSVEEVCTDNNVDVNTFLAVVNFVAHSIPLSQIPISDISVPSILQYLRQSHIYFLEYCLPEIRRKLLDGIHFSTSDISFLILKFFDEYTQEVKLHMDFEEKHVFDYVIRLLQGKTDPNFKISTYSDHHDQVASKLKELKTLIIRYCPEGSHTNLLNSALYDIYRCEDELSNHCMVEDHLFVPAIEHLENSLCKLPREEANSL